MYNKFKVNKLQFVKYNQYAGKESFMKPEVSRIFKFEDLEIKVKFRFCEKCQKYIGEYPDFEEAPLYTRKGYKVVTATEDKCSYYEAKEPSVDCGSCDHYSVANDGDLIGLCTNEEKRLGAEVQRIDR